MAYVTSQEVSTSTNRLRSLMLSVHGIVLSETNLGGSSPEQTRYFLLLLNLSYASDNAWLVDTTSDIVLVCLISPVWQHFA